MMAAPMWTERSVADLYRRVTELLCYSLVTGEFTNRVTRHWSAASGAFAGTTASLST